MLNAKLIRVWATPTLRSAFCTLHSALKTHCIYKGENYE